MDTSTTSIVTALGGGSGIDMASLASNLAGAQFQTRISQLTTQGDTLERKISAASTLKSQILQLATALGDRVRTGDLSSAPTISNSSVATVTRNTASQPAGNYTLEVQSLAAAQALAGPPYASATSAVGAGTLTLRFGTVTSGAFAEDSGHAAVNITIPSGATLTQVANAINKAGAGVQAYVANGSDGAKLVIKGQEGAANGFILEASETPGEEGLAALAWEPAGGSPSRLLTGSANAQFMLDGIAMTSASNTITNAAPGLSLALKGTNAGSPAQIGFTNPAAAITTAMQDITSALNEIVASLKQAMDPTTGDLSRDDGARALRRQFSSLAGTKIMPGAAAGAPSMLADLGLATERDGTFRLDGERLQETLARDPAGAAAMFTTSLYGVYSTVDKIARSASLSSNPGSLAGSISRYSAQQSRVREQNTKIAEQQESLRARLSKQFTAADIRIGASKSTLSFLQAQVALWNSSNN